MSDPEQQPKTELRRVKRRRLKVPMQMYDRKTGKLVGYLGNISLEGVLMISQESIAPDTL